MKCICAQGNRLLLIVDDRHNEDWNACRCRIVLDFLQQIPGVLTFEKNIEHDSGSLKLYQRIASLFQIPSWHNLEVAVLEVFFVNEECLWIVFDDQDRQLVSLQFSSDLGHIGNARRTFKMNRHGYRKRRS